MINQGPLFVILLSLFVSVQSQYAYDCRRLDDCQNSGICNTGDCNCTGTFGNYDCGMDTALTRCARACENGGTCYTEGSNATCFCPFGYHGTLCELTSVDIICSGDKAEFVLIFPSAFEGEVSLVDGDSAIDEGACAVTQTVEGPYKKFSIAIDISSSQDATNTPCNVSNLQTIGNSTTGEKMFRASLFVRYMKGIISIFDETYHGNCSHDKQTVLNQGVQNVVVDNKNLSANEFADVYHAPISLAVVDDNDALLTTGGVLYMGSIFKLVAYLTDTVAYKTVIFERCEANNTLEGDSELKFLILDKGCPTNQVKYFTTGQSFGTYAVNSVDFPAAKLPIEAFVFTNSDKIGIVCTAILCKAGDDSCAIPSDCDAVRKGVTAPPADAKPTTETAVTTDSDITTEAAATTDAGPTTEAAATTDADTTTETAVTTDSDTTTEATATTDAGPTTEAAATTDADTTTEAAATTDADTTTEATATTDAESTTEAAATTTAANAGRKRRAADDVNSDVKDKETLSAVIRILGPNDVSDRSRSLSEMEQPLATVENCFTRSEILAVVTVLAGLVCVLLITSLVLACLIFKRKAKSVEFESMLAPPSD